jgi:hypothetical protein
MARPLDTGQEFATYLLFLLIPIMIYQLVFLAIPKDPMLLHILAKDTRQDNSMAPPGASSRCSSKEDQVFQETKEETQRSKNPRHDDQKAPQLPRTGILCRHKGWLLH